MKVVNLKYSDYTLYIGRENRTYNLKASKWANPYPLTEYSLQDSLMLYEKHVIDSGLYNDLHELEDQILGCWCITDKNQFCHGNILIRLYNEKKLNDMIK